MFFVQNLASIANVYIKSVGIAFLLIAQVAMGSAAFQRGYPVDLSISHNFSAMGSHNATPLLESSSAKAGSLHLDDILNSATASLKSSEPEILKLTAISNPEVAILSMRKYNHIGPMFDASTRLDSINPNQVEVLLNYVRAIFFLRHY